MKKSFILLATLLFAATNMSAQRTIKNMKFGSQTLNVTEESFVKKLEKAGWTAVEAENTTLEGRINGIEVTATITPDKESAVLMRQLCPPCSSDRREIYLSLRTVTDWIYLPCPSC